MNTDLLTPTEMDVHVKNGTFRLAFVGMSNAGKSYRSRILQNELDFYWYEVDGHIRVKLGIENVDEMNDWLGLPSSETYQERSIAYLAAEEASTHLDYLDTGGKNLVFDTTGSVIYLSNKAKNWLHNECLVVNIDVGEDSLKEMEERYLREPKPVIWGTIFEKHKQESEADALARCYPLLLKDRIEKYRDFAHLSIPFIELFNKNGEETLAVIKSKL